MPNQYSFKYNFDNAEFKNVNLITKVRRTNSRIPDPTQVSLSQLRQNMLPISNDKYNDLISLCVEDVIPKEHHLFYVFLPHEKDSCV